MKCMVCGAPATVFITETVNGKTCRKFLCGNCARKGEENAYRQSRAGYGVKEAVCPNCKTRLSEFLKTGFLGCPDCYSAFGGAIADMLPKIQGKTRHIPRGHMGRVNDTREDKVRALKAELERADREMRYDDADKILRQLRSMGEV